jgi:dUTPase
MEPPSNRCCPPYNAGEIGVIILNTGNEAFVIERGARIAQAVLAPVCRARWQEAETLDITARDAGGFGSTGAGPESVSSRIIEPE